MSLGLLLPLADIVSACILALTGLVLSWLGYRRDRHLRRARRRWGLFALTFESLAVGIISVPVATFLPSPTSTILPGIGVVALGVSTFALVEFMIERWRGEAE